MPVQPEGSVPHRLEIVTVRDGQTVWLGPDDRLEYMSSRSDLNLGGTLHTFAVLRVKAVPR